MASGRKSSRRQGHSQNGENEAPLEEQDEYHDTVKRRELRSQYIDLMGKTQEEKLDLVKPENQKLSEILAKTERLFDKVRHTREASLDSKLVLQVSHLATQQAQKLQADFVTFEPSVFAEKLAGFMARERLTDLQANDDEEDSDNDYSDRELNWDKLDMFAGSFFKTTPTLTFMLGPLVIVAPAKKQRNAVERQKRPDESQKVIPTQLDKVEEQEEATTREVQRILTLLKRLTSEGESKLSFFEFVVDPQSFGRTVENIFHVSFLVKDGKCSVDMENGIPFITPHKVYQENEQEEPIFRKQIVLALSMDQWKELIDVFNIKTPMIPRRGTGN